MTKPYQYRNRRIAAPEYNHGGSVVRTGDQEVLTGIVNGMKASDLEERSARSLEKLETSYDFRVRITSEALGRQRLTKQFANIRGEIEIDFLAERNGVVTPIFVDGSIAHFFTPYQADADKAKADAANEFGRRLGWRPSVRVPFWKLETQDAADKTYREIFL